MKVPCKVLGAIGARVPSVSRKFLHVHAVAQCFVHRIDQVEIAKTETRVEYAAHAVPWTSGPESGHLAGGEEPAGRVDHAKQQLGHHETDNTTEQE